MKKKVSMVVGTNLIFRSQKYLSDNEMQIGFFVVFSIFFSPASE